MNDLPKGILRKELDGRVLVSIPDCPGAGKMFREGKVQCFFRIERELEEIVVRDVDFFWRVRRALSPLVGGAWVYNDKAQIVANMVYLNYQAVITKVYDLTLWRDGKQVNVPQGNP